MKAVAAQMKRIMEGMKLVVNSFEEVRVFGLEGPVADCVSVVSA
jgi:hypothetical protein